MSDKRLTIRNSTAEFLVFTSQANEDGIEVRVEDENIWLPQKRIAESSTTEVFSVVQLEGKREVSGHE